MSRLAEKRRQLSSLAIAKRGIAEVPERRTIRELQDGQKIFDLYMWKEVLQESGDGGKVVVCRPKDEPDSPTSPGGTRRRDKYVMKIRSKKELRDKNLESTFRKVQERTLNLPPHEGVVELIDVLEDSDFYFLVMEKVSGGSFFEGLLNEYTNGIIPLPEVKRLTAEMLKAVSHIHSQGMLHRDIKPDNFVMEIRDEPDSPSGKLVSPKLCDFDHAHPDWNAEHTRQQSGGRWGTLNFNAPETFMARCSEQSDLYSVGACLYLLMTGTMPYPSDLFEEGTLEDMYHRMMKFEVDWNCDPFPEQPQCKELCQGLLAWDEKDRIKSCEEALQASWFVAE